MEEKVILVDVDDKPIGEMPKQECHVKGVLHRAFSVFVFNSQGQILLQQRAFSKYHSPGLWTNTCCSHPRVGETTLEAANRRLHEEMGFDCHLTEKFAFTYQAEVGCGLIEHEIDHVFFGFSDEKPIINREEVESWKYITLNDLKHDIELNPQNYTQWFKIIFDRVLKMVCSLR